ncbi:serine/threonine-protein kinase [Actinotalea sp. K2]|uniref:serine/threonine-protein kinase n=1 Tax=Actinotalea sp. K2 TaxID=2939438 RepID=UPI002016BF45|nr:serine/threonine-protein kinase [Actinotalea sp. K2]MCL3861501.1 serine/threonine protein kinase [Actinotalea sp. K2]
MERIGVVPGTEIGGYRVLTPLGQGGMGAVYRAVDGGGTVVALKLLHAHLDADPDARERLRREVANLQRLRHPGVARVLDAEIDSSEAFVVTELLEGEDLAAHVRRQGPLPPTDLVALAGALREALAAVHEAGVLHRDLTPGNVLVTPTGPVLIDFGIAQAVEDARVTSTGLVVGTPGYLSPELLEGGEPSTAGDWWGWAALVAFAATGRPPFGTRPLQAVLARARSGEADLEGLDPRTAAALRSALAVDPARRLPPEDLVSELTRAAAGDGGATSVLEVPGQDTAGTQVLRSTGATAALGAGADGSAGAAGVTRVLTTDGVHEDHRDDDHLDDTSDDDYGDDEDLDGYDDDDRGPGPEGYVDPYSTDAAEGWPPRPEPRRRIGTVLALAAVLVVLGSTSPGVALLVAAVLALLVRAVGLAVAGVLGRRERRGVRRGDVTRAVVGTPWYLLRGLLGLLPGVLVAVSAVVLVGGVGWWLLGSGRFVLAESADGEPAGNLGQNAAWVEPALLAFVVLIGLLLIWFGPTARTTRVGARWSLAALAPGRAGAAVVVLLALAACAVLVAATLQGETATVWWPLPGPPGLR